MHPNNQESGLQYAFQETQHSISENKMIGSRGGRLFISAGLGERKKVAIRPGLQT